MKTVLMLLLTCGGLWAQTPISFTLYNASNPTSSAPLPSTYAFADTAQGTETSIELIPVNSTNAPIEIISISVSDAQDFSVTSALVDAQIAGGGSGPAFYVHFVPRRVASFTASMTVTYCLLNASGTCSTNPAPTETAATFQGNGTIPQVTLSCTGSPSACGGTLLYPETTVDFGNVSDGSSASATFWLLNNSPSAVTTQNLVTLKTAIFNTTPFALDTSSLPASLAAGASASFTMTFSPGQAALMQGTLVVGGNSYPLQGAGVASVLGDVSSLVVTYTDQTGVRLTAQGGSPINFGQTIAGTAGTATLNFVVSNPQTTIGAVNVPAVSVSGSGFTIAGLPSMPASLQPGGTLAFQVTFAASTIGSYNGTLSIGTLQFALAAQSVNPPLPAASFQISQQPLTSDQQVNLTIQFASPSQGQHTPILTMTFAPSVQNVSDDPAIEFLATNARQLSLDQIPPGSQTATYNGQSAIAFQTGTTAGTITFTLTDAGITVGTQSFDIAPEKVHIGSATATISSPNLVITINDCYDNTYSTGQLSFTFYDTKGNVIAPGAVAVDASTQFKQWFFSDSKVGGAFGLLATFPVYGGDASGVGSVSVTLNNSTGPVTITQTFQ